MFFLIILLIFSNGNKSIIEHQWVLKEIYQNRIKESFSVDVNANYDNMLTENYKISFLKNNEDDFPFLYFKNLRNNKEIIITNKQYEFSNDTLRLIENKNLIREGYYSAFYCLLFKNSGKKLKNPQFYDYNVLFEKIANLDLKEEENKIYKNCEMNIDYLDSQIVVDIKLHVYRLEPFYTNVKIQSKYKFNLNYKLVELYDEQTHFDESYNTKSSLSLNLKFTNYNFNTPDSSLFNVDRPYNVFIDLDSQRIAIDNNLKERKKTAHILPDKVLLLNQETVDLTKQKDIKVYNFWGSWCGFCYKSYPSIQKIYNEFGEKVEVIGWGAMERDTSKIAPYIKKNKINYPYILGADSLSNKLAIQGFPTTQIYKGNELYYKCKNNNDSLYYEIKAKLKELGIE
jgi:thiol-disulfide isomerase/thioredoxin